MLRLRGICLRVKRVGAEDVVANCIVRRYSVQLRGNPPAVGRILTMRVGVRAIAGVSGAKRHNRRRMRTKKARRSRSRERRAQLRFGLVADAISPRGRGAVGHSGR